jgi:choline dehydrogenase-like flavoprotein
MLANEFVRLPYLFARSMHRRGGPRWGIEHKKFQREFYKRTISVKGPGQEMPVFTNRVEVDPSVRDHWGIPVARITGRRHPEDFITGKFIAERAAEWLKAAGALEVWATPPGKGVTGGQHQAGTCRMGNDPKTSVVNQWCQVHDVDNVFIGDGSPLVTNGGFNPSLTIQALAYRTSDYIVRSWKDKLSRA